MLKSQELLDRYLANRPEAMASCVEFRMLCHGVDDIFDIPERRADNEFIGMILNKYIDFFSSDFYVRYRLRLYSIVKQIHNTYMDSLAWEKSDTEWKAKYADITRCCLIEYMLNVVEIVVNEEGGDGYRARREISLVSKEESWLNHHDDNGKSI